MATLVKGAPVRQIVKAIEGTVQGYQIDQETGDRLILVGWEDSEGQHSRYFTETDLELVAAPSA